MLKCNCNKRGNRWKEKKKLKKNIINLIIFILLIILTFYIVLKDQDVSQMIQIVRNAKKKFILIGVALMLMYFSCEAINVGRILKRTWRKIEFCKKL